jgi:hypothetical protein
MEYLDGIDAMPTYKRMYLYLKNDHYVNLWGFR